MCDYQGADEQTGMVLGHELSKGRDLVLKLVPLELLGLAKVSLLYDVICHDDTAEIPFDVWGSM